MKDYIYAWCSACSKPLRGIHGPRLRRNPNRRCMECFRKTVTHRHLSQGYVRLEFKDGTRKYEHQVIAEKKLGRKLRRGEVVHHINGDRADNSPDNIHVHRSAGQHVLREGHVVRGVDGKFKAGWVTS